jgi:hypothetical protein
MSQKRFIITQSVEVKDKLIANGVKLISEANGTYTFVNELPTKFSFNEADVKKIAYTNILSM